MNWIEINYFLFFLSNTFLVYANKTDDNNQDDDYDKICKICTHFEWNQWKNTDRKHRVDEKNEILRCFLWIMFMCARKTIDIEIFNEENKNQGLCWRGKIMYADIRKKTEIRIQIGRNIDWKRESSQKKITRFVFDIQQSKEEREKTLVNITMMKIESTVAIVWKFHSWLISVWILFFSLSIGCRMCS